MVKIQVPDGFDLDSLPYFPPNGQDSAEICSKCQLQFLRLMALPVIEESSYLGLSSRTEGGRDPSNWQYLAGIQKERRNSPPPPPPPPPPATPHSTATGNEPVEVTKDPKPPSRSESDALNVCPFPICTSVYFWRFV